MMMRNVFARPHGCAGMDHPASFDARTGAARRLRLLRLQSALVHIGVVAGLLVLLGVGVRWTVRQIDTIAVSKGRAVPSGGAVLGRRPARELTSAQATAVDASDAHGCFAVRVVWHPVTVRP